MEMAVVGNGSRGPKGPAPLSPSPSPSFSSFRILFLSEQTPAVIAWKRGRLYLVVACPCSYQLLHKLRYRRFPSADLSYIPNW